MAAGLGDSEDTVPNVLDFPNSLTSTDFLSELHDFTRYMADDDRPQDQAVVEHLEDSEDTILTTNGPSVTAEALDEIPDLCGYVVEGSCPKE